MPLRLWDRVPNYGDDPGWFGVWIISWLHKARAEADGDYILHRDGLLFTRSTHAYKSIDISLYLPKKQVFHFQWRYAENPNLCKVAWRNLDGSVEYIDSDEAHRRTEEALSQFDIGHHCIPTPGEVYD